MKSRQWTGRSGRPYQCIHGLVTSGSFATRIARLVVTKFEIGQITTSGDPWKSHMYNVEYEIIPRVDAQRRVTRFVALTLGTQLLGGEPEDDRPRDFDEGLYWEVPVLLTIPHRGVVGQVGEILVDAQSGELRLEDDTLQSITTNAERLSKR